MSEKEINMAQFLEKHFKLAQNKTNVRTEVIAGITTFLTMSYILLVNPSTLSAPAFILGQDALGTQISNGVFVATCLASFLGTMLMALMANLPFALAPGMGLNATFAYTVMLTMGYSYAEALGIVFISGMVFIAISIFGLREMVVKAIPDNLKVAISGGIGLFIAFIGMQNSNIVVNNDAILVSLTNLSDLAQPATRNAIVALIGLVVIAVCSAKRIKGSILIGIVAATVVGVPLGVTTMPANFTVDLAPVFKDFTEISIGSFAQGLSSLFGGKNIFQVIGQIFLVVLSLSLIDMMDTIGTLIGTATSAGMLDKDGNVKNMKQALMSDAIATVAGSMLGTSTVTTFVESGSGISEGGRTGLTSVVTALLFLPAILLAPFIALIPSAATAPALIYVGVLMMGSVLRIDFSDITEAVPAFLTISLMPLTYSIGNGIAFGIMFYVALKVLTGKFKDINPTIVILGILFAIRYALMV